MLYLEFLKQVSKFKKFAIGKSEQGRPIYAVRVGSGNKTILVQGGMHAREYWTAFLVLRLIEFYKDIDGISILFIPLVNPDGMVMCDERPLWKANAIGVDLNVNWPARWGKGKRNVRVAGSENFIGDNPLCAKENYALFRLVNKLNIIYTISYHSRGNEIYWNFFCKSKEHRRIAKIVSKSTGYPLARAGRSAGGFKDFIIQNLGIPSVTIEVGNGDTPYDKIGEEMNEIFDCNKNVISDIIKHVFRTGKERGNKS